MALLAAVVLLAPLAMPNNYWVEVAILIGINAIICVGLNLLIGYAGQISLGHAGFFGLGAYGSAILTARYGWPPAAALGAVAGILIAPITLTAWDVGVMLGLKGFAAAILGGLGSGPGAVVGGLALGVVESLGAGYLSSAYKDAIAFVIILAVLFFMPSGLLGKKSAERV